MGINAHIQRDFPFVLYELYLQGHPVSYEDHTRTNEFLKQVNPLQELAEKLDPTIDDLDIPGDEDDVQRFQTIVPRVRAHTATLNDSEMQLMMHSVRK